jgi:hypothetical protein
MGYTTKFMGEFKIDKPVDEKTYKLLDGLNKTRRMKRDSKKLAERLGKTEEDVINLYGDECEFWVEDSNDHGQDCTSDIVDYNKPPKSQPGLWCHWRMQEDCQTIDWDEGEKFYSYIEWVTYIIDKILKPRGYVVNGSVDWRGEDFYDNGFIIIKDNTVIAEARG